VVDDKENAQAKSNTPTRSVNSNNAKSKNQLNLMRRLTTLKQHIGGLMIDDTEVYPKTSRADPSTAMLSQAQPAQWRITSESRRDAYNRQQSDECFVAKTQAYQIRHLNTGVDAL
jgi:hypothetical protein